MSGFRNIPGMAITLTADDSNTEFQCNFKLTSTETTSTMIRQTDIRLKIRLLTHASRFDFDILV